MKRKYVKLVAILTKLTPQMMLGDLPSWLPRSCTMVIVPSSSLSATPASIMSVRHWYAW